MIRDEALECYVEYYQDVIKVEINWDNYGTFEGNMDSILEIPVNVTGVSTGDGLFIDDLETLIDECGDMYFDSLYDYRQGNYRKFTDWLSEDNYDKVYKRED